MSRIIRGTVSEGEGQGRVFTQLEWVRRQFREKLGFDPYPGTLNLRVADAGMLSAYRARAGIVIVPETSDYCSAKCFRVRVNGRIAAAWILPGVPNYPADQIELMAPVSLRDVLGLETGDAAQVEWLEGEA